MSQNRKIHTNQCHLKNRKDHMDTTKEMRLENLSERKIQKKRIDMNNKLFLILQLKDQVIENIILIIKINNFQVIVF